MKALVDFILHFDKYLEVIINQFGVFTYVILFAIIFAETGFVVTPFLPGDSLLFVAGTLAGKGYLNIVGLYLTLLVAAILGDTANYWIGHYFGPKVFQKKNSRLFNPEYLEKTRKFFAKYGGKTVIIARFIPIVRTFAPFVAGVGAMHYPQFIMYNVVGAFLWVTLFTWGGYFLGSLPIIQENFHTAIIVIIFISLLPPIYEFIQHRREKHRAVHVDFEKVEKTFEKQHLVD
ncbi:DedA family protein [Candidatus Microgenomates bacterium]|nr:MAG: DedA family protein [Candidatus Microgenomates bacterium]